MDTKNNTSETKLDRIEKTTAFLLIGSLILIIMGALNPDLQTHQQAVKQHMNKQIAEYTEWELRNSHSEEERAGTILGMAMASGMTDGLVQTYISRDDFIIFSLTKNASDETIGLGIFGQVSIFHQSDVNSEGRKLRLD